VNGALWLLIRLGFRGRIRRSLRLTRQPRYLLGSVVGIAYFVFMVFRPLLQGDTHMVAHLDALSLVLFQGIHVFAALGIALYLSLSWVLMPVKPPLRLRPSEMNLLLPAPLRRREIIVYGMVRTIPGMLVGVFVVMLFVSSGSLLMRTVQAVNVFALFLLWDLHGKGRNLWKARLREMPRTRALSRRVLMMLVVALFWAVAVGAILAIGKSVIAVLHDAGTVDRDTVTSVLGAIGEGVRRGPLHVLLAPLLWITEPFFARGRIGGGPWFFLMAVLVLHFVWVLWAEARYEDTVIARERSRARGLRRRRDPRHHSQAARRSHVFRLGPIGRPEIAIYWKDLLVLTRKNARFWGLLGLGLFAIVLAAVVILGAPEKLIVPMTSVGFMAVGFVPPLTGVFWANGFRRDLRYFETLRTWPVSGRKLVLGELLAPLTQTMVAVAGGLGLLIATDLGSRIAGVLGLGEGGGVFPESWASSLGVPEPILLGWIILGALPVLAGLGALSSILECLGGLLFPGWLLVLDKQRGDPAAFGQRILTILAFGFVMLFGILPGALSVAILLFGQHLLGLSITAWEFPLLGLLAALPLAGEAWILLRYAGGLWDRLDPSREILEGFS